MKPLSALPPLEIGAAYIRVSTDDQTELSPDAQVRVIMDSAKADGFIIPKEFIFIEKKGISGRKAENRPDQQRALESNRASQQVADEAAKAYRRYLQQQREQIAGARMKATHDLKIADNTYETVEASVQLRNLIRESSTSFEAIQKLEAPSFDQIFKSDELRREFEHLTRKLDVPAS